MVGGNGNGGGGGRVNKGNNYDREGSKNRRYSYCIY